MKWANNLSFDCNVVPGMPILCHVAAATAAKLLLVLLVLSSDIDSSIAHSLFNHQLPCCKNSG